MAEKTRVLFVDDELLVLQGLQRLMRNMRSEWDMEFVDSGPKALEAMARNPFDVVVADMRMPGMNGAELLTRVMERYPGTVRLVLSGHADPELILQVEGVAHQFLSKPCDPETLRAVILSAGNLGGALRGHEIIRVLGGIAHLPVLPLTYKAVMDLLERESTTVEDLGRVVKRDPAMTVNILKLVNSAYFGLRQRVSDPAEAVAFLGVETLKALALFQGIFHQVRDFPAEFNGDHLWQHSLDLAAASREIARLEGQDRSFQADCFTAGLIHDVGLLILASGFPERYREIARILAEEPLGLIQAEMRVVGVHHGEVGAHLLGLWGLPDTVVAAVSSHHSPPEAFGMTPSLVVAAAEALSAAQGDWRVFRLQREGDPGPLAGVLGPRMEPWTRALERVVDSGGTS